jgi:hypothetical protein
MKGNQFLTLLMWINKTRKAMARTATLISLRWSPLDHLAAEGHSRATPFSRRLATAAAIFFAKPLGNFG